VIKFFIMADSNISVLAYNMCKFMNGIQRNGGVVLSTDIVRDMASSAGGPPLFTGIVFYSETRKRDE
jgi:hypothetical protein